MNEKGCHGSHACRFCGMDMDMEPFCVNKAVLAKRTAQTGRAYDWGLDINVAYPLCQYEHWERKEVRGGQVSGS